MKTHCDHCDQELSDIIKNLASNYTNDSACWCDNCINVDYQLLNNIGLITATGQPLLYSAPPSKGFWAIPENVKKILAIPKKNVVLDSVAEMTEPPPAPMEPTDQTPAFDFDHYNSLDYAYKLLQLSRGKNNADQ